MTLNDLPSVEMVHKLLDRIAPASTLVEVAPLPNSLSNATHLVVACAADGSEVRLVVRRYAVFGSYDRGEKARREFKALELVQAHEIPAPRPLFLDDEGTLLGAPGIVTSFVPGVQVDAPDEPVPWAGALAAMLARIHAVPCDAATRRFLLDANAEATWFLRPDDVPDFMRAHPDGPAVWRATRALWPDLQHGPASLVHIDYWSGNILWDRGRISAVLDWEEAAHGDGGIDVGYCRMDLCLSGMGHVADEFLAAYEA